MARMPEERVPAKRGTSLCRIERRYLSDRTIYYLGMFGGFALATVVLVYKPDTRYVHVPCPLSPSPTPLLLSQSSLVS